MTFTLYRIPQLKANKQNTLSFIDSDSRNMFFNAITLKFTASEEDSTIGRITDISKLYQQVTVFTNGRNPYTLYNYARIISGGKSYFYFVTDYREIGNSQVVYSLKKDTLVTYVTTLSSPDVNLSQFKSLVTKEHKPRFNFDTSRVLYHRIPEPGDNTTPKVVSDNPFNIHTRARLVYKNRTDSKPVAYPYVETATNVTVQGSDWIGTVTSSYLGSDEAMYMWDGDFQYTYGTGTPNISLSIPSDRFVKYERQTTGNRWVREYLKSDGTQLGIRLIVPNGVDLRIKVCTTNIQRLIVAPNYVGHPTSWTNIITSYDTINFQPTRTVALPLWSAIDQYDAMTDRIIEVPYFIASNFTFYEDGYGIFIPLESSANIDLGMTFTRRPLGGVFDTSRVDKNKVPHNEPKLYTSQFSPFMYIMNGAVIGLKREAREGGFPFSGAETTTVNFNYDLLTPSSFRLKVTPPGTYELEDADELRQIWDVNNEIASIKDEAYTYNQYYKDLDDKQRRIQESAAVRNTALNAVNQGLGVVGGMIAGGVPNPVQIAARTGQATINIAQSIMDLQDQLKMNGIAAKQKYIGLLLSSTQISGASLNFLKTFGGDRVRALQFSLTNEELDYWDTVFHKYGYTTLEYKIPVLKTRRYWDYKQMIIDELSSAFINDECIDDIRNRFAEGVTIFHYQSAIAPESVNWTQTKENWEI